MFSLQVFVFLSDLDSVSFILELSCYLFAPLGKGFFPRNVRPARDLIAETRLWINPRDRFRIFDLYCISF